MNDSSVYRQTVAALANQMVGTRLIIFQDGTHSLTTSPNCVNGQSGMSQAEFADFIDEQAGSIDAWIADDYRIRDLMFTGHQFEYICHRHAPLPCSMWVKKPGGEWEFISTVFEWAKVGKKTDADWTNALLNCVGLGKKSEPETMTLTREEAQQVRDLLNKARAFFTVYLDI